MWEACDALGLSDRTIRRLIGEGRLEGDKVAGKWWVKRIDPASFAGTARHGTAVDSLPEFEKVNDNNKTPPTPDLNAAKAPTSKPSRLEDLIGVARIGAWDKLMALSQQRQHQQGSGQHGAQRQADF